VDSTLDRLSVSDMAAQVIVTWINGAYTSTESDDFDEAVARVERGFGGLWIMGGLPYERAEKLNALQRHAKVPLLVTGPALGGRLFAPQRDAWLMGGGTDIPPELAYAAIGEPSAVREAGRIIGEEARAIGMHVGDGPEATVLTNFRNVLINRTFGDDPEQVGILSAA
jgi:beta-xylosidase